MGTGKKYNFDDAVNAFFTESRDMLEEMESNLLDLEKDKLDEESIHAVFRAIHTIKGTAGMFGLVDIGEFTHVVENILDEIRNGMKHIDDEMLSIFFECHDFISKMIEFFNINRKGKMDKGMKQESRELLAKLSSSLPAESGESEDNDRSVEGTQETESASDAIVKNKCWHLSLRFGPDTFRHGFDPQTFISYLNGMGEIASIKVISDSIPSLEEINAEVCYLGFEIDFMGSTTKEELVDIFDLMDDDCTLRILPPRSSVTDYVKLIQDLPEKSMYIGKILTEIGSLTEKELEDALGMQLDSVESDKQVRRIGEIIVEEKMVQKKVLDEALKKQTHIRKSMRVDTSKLDTLINLVGELVINVANVKQLARNTGESELEESLSTLSMLVENIRDNSLNMRMVQIGESLKRFERIVRDLSREQGKEIDLVLSGGETELDKTLVEKVMDPLMHVIRNAVDHGIDPPDVRAALGKSRRGKVRIDAFNETGSIVIEIRDDGNGLNREKILRRAVEMQLIGYDETGKLSDSEVYQFIFLPGFSTAEKVTNISGRGVGMDVVRQNVNSLRGVVLLHSVEGEGTMIRIQLPLTLAIIDGFMVQTGDDIYVLPLEMVSECVHFDSKIIDRSESGNFIDLRGDFIPYLRLRDFFHITGEPPDKENIIIIEYSKTRAGIVVDRSLGELQTVVKPLGRIFHKMQWINGATILGSGEVALILDVPRLIQYVQAVQHKETV